MATAPLATMGSRTAAGGVILLLLSVPMINSLVENESLQSALLVVIAILLGCGMGWVIGDAVVNSAILGKLLAGVLALIAAGLGLFLPAWRLARGDETPDAKSFFYHFFAEPLESASFEGALRYATILFVITALIAVVNGSRPSIPNTPPLDARGGAGDRKKRFPAISRG